MSTRLMTPTDLEAVTGMKRYTKQADWFKRQFGIDVLRRADGSIVMTWATYEALAAGKAGILHVRADDLPTEVCSPFA